jgi:glycosyltransferase involved in cell wall biosynthesis
VLVPAGDLSALRAAAVDLLNDPARRADAGALGREVVLAEHSWDAIAKRLEQIYAAVT